MALGRLHDVLRGCFGDGYDCRVHGGAEWREAEAGNWVEVIELPVGFGRAFAMRFYGICGMLCYFDLLVSGSWDANVFLLRRRTSSITMTSSSSAGHWERLGSSVSLAGLSLSSPPQLSPYRPISSHPRVDMSLYRASDITGSLMC